MSDDLIRRQEVLNKLNELDQQELYLPCHFKEYVIDEVSNIPQKTGRWIFEKGDGETCVDGYICSACGRSYHTKVPYFSEFDFCPCCGANMESDGKNDKI